MVKLRRNFKAAIIRALRTAVQAAAGAVGIAQISSIDWQQVAGLSAAAALASLLSGLASTLPEVDGKEGF